MGMERTRVLWDGGAIKSVADAALVNWTNTAGSKDRHAPTGEIRNVNGTGPGKFAGGDALPGLKYTGKSNRFNASAI